MGQLERPMNVFKVSNMDYGFYGSNRRSSSSCYANQLFFVIMLGQIAALL